MKRIKVLDCTLRDGGYCNDCRFGFENEKKIARGLVDANIEIIECGFFTSKIIYDKECTRFTSLNEVSQIIPTSRGDKLFVLLMNYGDYDIDNLPYYDGSSVDGLRVAFHKKDRIKALDVCRKIKDKGYKVFIQPMVSLSYTDEEFLDLILRVNLFEPYAFYIVDSFGMMNRKDLRRLFYLADHNLKESIYIGFHSHNNMQLAYSNAQCMVDMQTSRTLIVDSSIFGMGRGAGNLNTELFVQYLNDTIECKYSLKPLLSIIDEILNKFYQENYWGYSLPNYLSASHNAHPNYANYLDDKKTLTVEAMNEIFELMDEEKKVSYDKNYIEELYVRYMTTGEIQIKRKYEFREKIKGKKVVLIAPGMSSREETEIIKAFIKDTGAISVSINFDYPGVETDFIFLSNLRRYRELEKNKGYKCIVTSNISADNVYLQIAYKDLLVEYDVVKDNAGLMAIKFFMDYEIEELYLAGYDGYSHDDAKNYGDNQMAFITKNAILDAMNEGMNKILQQYSNKINIQFLTKPHFLQLRGENK